MNYAALIKAISSATTELQARAATAVNQALVVRNWMVGAWIVELEQSGRYRARYGARLLPTLARDLKGRGIRGLDDRSLLDCRLLYKLYPQIPGTLSPEFNAPGTRSKKPGTASPEFAGLLLPSAKKLRAFIEADPGRLESLMSKSPGSKLVRSRKPLR